MGSTPSRRRLIINADDFGISHGVNTGIIEAAGAGAVTSASLIVNLPAFTDAIVGAQSCPSLSLGLHLNFTTGRPLSGARSLTGRATGEFHSLPALLGQASLGLLDASDVELEATAQIDRMIDAGFRPTHVDSHRHVHAHPAIWSAVVRSTASRGISHIRVPRESLKVNPGDWRATLKKAGLLACTRLSHHAAANTPQFFGISLQGGKSFATRLLALIPRLPSGTSELMTHPGYADSSLAEHDGYTVEREKELAVLCSREFRELLDRYEITLTSFADLDSTRPAKNQIAQHH